MQRRPTHRQPALARTRARAKFQGDGNDQVFTENQVAVNDYEALRTKLLKDMADAGTELIPLVRSLDDAINQFGPRPGASQVPSDAANGFVTLRAKLQRTARALDTASRRTWFAGDVNAGSLDDFVGFYNLFRGFGRALEKDPSMVALRKLMGQDGLPVTRDNYNEAQNVGVTMLGEHTKTMAALYADCVKRANNVEAVIAGLMTSAPTADSARAVATLIKLVALLEGVASWSFESTKKMSDGFSQEERAERDAEALEAFAYLTRDPFVHLIEAGVPGERQSGMFQTFKNLFGLGGSNGDTDPTTEELALAYAARIGLDQTTSPYVDFAVTYATGVEECARRANHANFVGQGRLLALMKSQGNSRTPSSSELSKRNLFAADERDRVKKRAEACSKAADWIRGWNATDVRVPLAPPCIAAADRRVKEAVLAHVPRQSSKPTDHALQLSAVRSLLDATFPSTIDVAATLAPCNLDDDHIDNVVAERLRDFGLAFGEKVKELKRNDGEILQWHERAKDVHPLRVANASVEELVKVKLSAELAALPAPAAVASNTAALTTDQQLVARRKLFQAATEQLDVLVALSQQTPNNLPETVIAGLTHKVDRQTLQDLYKAGAKQLVPPAPTADPATELRWQLDNLLELRPFPDAASLDQEDAEKVALRKWAHAFDLADVATFEATTSLLRRQAALQNRVFRRLASGREVEHVVDLGQAVVDARAYADDVRAQVDVLRADATASPRLVAALVREIIAAERVAATAQTLADELPLGTDHKTQLRRMDAELDVKYDLDGLQQGPVSVALALVKTRVPVAGQTPAEAARLVGGEALHNHFRYDEKHFQGLSARDLGDEAHQLKQLEQAALASEQKATGDLANAVDQVSAQRKIERLQADQRRYADVDAYLAAVVVDVDQMLQQGAQWTPTFGVQPPPPTPPNPPTPPPTASSPPTPPSTASNSPTPPPTASSLPTPPPTASNTPALPLIPAITPVQPGPAAPVQANPAAAAVPPIPAAAPVPPIPAAAPALPIPVAAPALPTAPVPVSAALGPGLMLPQAFPPPLLPPMRSWRDAPFYVRARTASNFGTHALDGQLDLFTDLVRQTSRVDDPLQLRGDFGDDYGF